MRIGTGVPPSRLGEILPQADFLELPARTIAALAPEDFSGLLSQVHDGTMKTYSCNCLIPNEFRLTGPDADLSVLREYILPLFERLARLKISMIVFGSGRSKSVPEGFPREKAWEQLYDIGVLLADTAREYGQTVAVEPLSYSETNIINTVSEAARYCDIVNRPNFRCLVDFYHFDNNAETLDSLPAVASYLVHAHIAAPKTRGMFQTPEEWVFVRRCVEALEEIGYTGALCYEGKYSPAPELNDLLIALKKEVNHAS